MRLKKKREMRVAMMCGRYLSRADVRAKLGVGSRK